MKVSRLANYKEKKKELSVATLQFDVAFCTPIPCAPSMSLLVATLTFANSLDPDQDR